MENARETILTALEQAPQIQAAGAGSLLALAARALDPEVALTRQELTRVLGLHPALQVAILVSADQLGDSEARRALGRTLFARLPLGCRPPQLTAQGQLTLSLFCLERLLPLDHLLDGLVAQVLAAGRLAADGSAPDKLELKALDEQAFEQQRTRLVTMEKNDKTRLGVPLQEVIRRRGSQALRALLDSLQQPAPHPQLLATVAGEVSAVLGQSLGPEAASDFCLALADALCQLPEGLAEPPQIN
jgi:hypothetical protein